MHMQRQLYIIIAFYVARGEKELYISGAILGAQGNESQIKKESTTDMPKTTNPVLQDVTQPYIICFCVCGEYAVNKTEYGSFFF